MFENPAEEWQSLTEHYRTMFDGELEQLAADYKDLTQTAKEVLCNEMRNRGLGDPGAPQKRPSRPATLAPEATASMVDPDGRTEQPNGSGEGEEDDRPREFTWKTPLCEPGSYGEAVEIHKALTKAGIDSWVEQPGKDRVSCLRIVVAEDQLEEAQEIAARPIAKELIDQYNEEVPEFELPKCPKCGADDPILESAEPTNSWLCEACGEQWTEQVAEGE